MFYRYGFVEYDSVDEAQTVFNNPENIELNGRVLYIDYATGQEIKKETTGKIFESPFKT